MERLDFGDGLSDELAHHTGSENEPEYLTGQRLKRHPFETTVRSSEPKSEPSFRTLRANQFHQIGVVN